MKKYRTSFGPVFLNVYTWENSGVGFAKSDSLSESIIEPCETLEIRWTAFSFSDYFLLHTLIYSSKYFIWIICEFGLFKL